MNFGIKLAKEYYEGGLENNEKVVFSVLPEFLFHFLFITGLGSI